MGVHGARSTDWLVDPAPLLLRLAGGDIRKANERARLALRTGKPGGRVPQHPDLLTQLSFGTWRFLLPDRDPGRQLLWHNALHHAFPQLVVTPSQLVTQVDGIHKLRNRVAHLEPLLRSGIVERQFKAIRSVLTAVDPHVEHWLVSRQRLTTVLRLRPA